MVECIKQKNTGWCFFESSDIEVSIAVGFPSALVSPSVGIVERHAPKRQEGWRGCSGVADMVAAAFVQALCSGAPLGCLRLPHGHAVDAHHEDADDQLGCDEDSGAGRKGPGGDDQEKGSRNG